MLSTSGGFLGAVAWDAARGKGEDAEVRRAAQLRDTITSLGPFFIKLGQALSIRPDILSPKAMVELQQLCDKVPSYPSAQAFGILCAELGVGDVGDVFSTITPEPVAAASLGQVRPRGVDVISTITRVPGCARGGGAEVAGGGLPLVFLNLSLCSGGFNVVGPAVPVLVQCGGARALSVGRCTRPRCGRVGPRWRSRCSGPSSSKR